MLRSYTVDGFCRNYFFPGFEELFYKEFKSKDLWHLSMEVPKTGKTTQHSPWGEELGQAAHSQRGGAYFHLSVAGSRHTETEADLGAQMISGIQGGPDEEVIAI